VSGYGKLRAHIKCPKCSGKIMEGVTFKNTIELSCLICGWRVEPEVALWNGEKDKLYKRLLSERTR
jgi:hypothetical protein